MPIQHRLSLLEWAKHNNGIIIEDDYDSEFRYDIRPLSSLQGFDTDGHVIYIGTFSKILSPALRISYMILPDKWLNLYNKLFSNIQSTVPWLSQSVLELFMKEGYWHSHIRKIRNSQKQRRNILVESIKNEMGNSVIIHGSNAGLHVMLELKNGLTEAKAIELANKMGIKIYPVSVYWMKKKNYSNNMVLIGFSGISETDIVDGIALLKKAWSYVI